MSSGLKVVIWNVFFINYSIFSIQKMLMQEIID